VGKIVLVKIVKMGLKMNILIKINDFTMFYLIKPKVFECLKSIKLFVIFTEFQRHNRKIEYASYHQYITSITTSVSLSDLFEDKNIFVILLSKVYNLISTHNYRWVFA
jgi:hypothetical protein